MFEIVEISAAPHLPYSLRNAIAEARTKECAVSAENARELLDDGIITTAPVN